MKNIFSYNQDINKNAYMNWRMSKHADIDNMISIAQGFMSSSIILAEDMLSDNKGKRADIVIFPILFNANHAIELYLKAITCTLNILLNNNSKIEGKHNIKQIFDIVQARVNELEKDRGRKEEFKNLTIDLQEYLKELFKKIETNTHGKYRDNMDFSRYPFNNKYVNHFYVDEFDNVVVDLENFVKRFKKISKNLELISKHYLYDHLYNVYKE